MRACPLAAAHPSRDHPDFGADRDWARLTSFGNDLSMQAAIVRAAAELSVKPVRAGSGISEFKSPARAARRTMRPRQAGNSHSRASRCPCSITTMRSAAASMGASTSRVRWAERSSPSLAASVSALG